jgi:glycosyltransferase involved in cell wall biosynthesis
MAECALRLLDDPDLSERLRAAGLEVARRFTWPIVREQLFDAYGAALVTGLGRSPRERHI